MMVAVTSTGFLMLFNENLELLRTKNISKDCLRACTINYDQRRGRKVLAVDGDGNIFNEYGQLVSRTKINHPVALHSIEKGNRIVVADGMGNTFQVRPTEAEPAEISIPETLTTPQNQGKDLWRVKKTEETHGEHEKAREHFFC
jgi:hypothetical protein